MAKCCLLPGGLVHRFLSDTSGVVTTDWLALVGAVTLGSSAAVASLGGAVGEIVTGAMIDDLHQVERAAGNPAGLTPGFVQTGISFGKHRGRASSNDDGEGQATVLDAIADEASAHDVIDGWPSSRPMDADPAFSEPVAHEQ